MSPTAGFVSLGRLRTDSGGCAQHNVLSAPLDPENILCSSPTLVWENISISQICVARPTLKQNLKPATGTTVRAAGWSCDLWVCALTLVMEMTCGRWSVGMSGWHRGPTRVRNHTGISTREPFDLSRSLVRCENLTSA